MTRWLSYSNADDEAVEAMKKHYMEMGTKGNTHSRHLEHLSWVENLSQREIN